MYQIIKKSNFGPRLARAALAIKVILMINKYVTGLLAFLICACSTADTSNAVDMAKANLADSIAKFSDKETACRSNAPKLQTEQLKRLELTKEELVSALSFHYLKSYTECSYKEAADLIVRLKIVNLLQDDPSMSGEEASKIIVADMKKLLDLEIAYKSIPENKRRLIEDIQGINKPFDMIKTAKSLGI